MKIEQISQSLGFGDVAILQNKNMCKSRLDVDISTEVIRGVKRSVPIIASNMISVVNADFIIQLHNLGALGIMHRGISEDEYVKHTKLVSNQNEWVAVSVGGKDLDKQFELAKKLVNSGANIITLDVAHAYADWFIEFGRKIKKELGVKVVIGDTNNTDMYMEVLDFADALKVCIGTGSVCETKNTAACYEKAFTTVYKFRELVSKYGLPIICDGGVREPADFTKAILAGANSVMAGRIFASCPESAARRVDDKPGLCEYYGMSSRPAMKILQGSVREGLCPEGRVEWIKEGEPVKDLINRYSGALRSGITYAGGYDIKTAQERVKFNAI